jgi:hypothetical protein
MRVGGMAGGRKLKKKYIKVVENILVQFFDRFGSISDLFFPAAPAPAQAKTNNEELNDSGASSFLSSPASRRSSSGSESSSSPEVATNNDLTKIQEFSTFSYLFESDLFNCEICRKEIVVAGSCEVADRHVREVKRKGQKTRFSVLEN